MTAYPLWNNLRLKCFNETSTYISPLNWRANWTVWIKPQLISIVWKRSYPKKEPSSEIYEMKLLSNWLNLARNMEMLSKGPDLTTTRQKKRSKWVISTKFAIMKSRYMLTWPDPEGGLHEKRAIHWCLPYNVGQWIVGEMLSRYYPTIHACRKTYALCCRQLKCFVLRWGLFIVHACPHRCWKVLRS